MHIDIASCILNPKPWIYGQQSMNKKLHKVVMNLW
jgi:hypothetical protein